MSIRNTPQRMIITECFDHLYHPTADEVWQFVKQSSPSVSKTTVYRNLNRMVDEGSLLRLTTPEGIDRYDDTTAKHYHVHCRNCGKIDDVDMPVQTALAQCIIDGRGYAIDDHDLLFIGVCPACRNTQAAANTAPNP